MSEFPERCTACGEEFQYFDDGSATQQLCNCNNGVADRELAYRDTGTRTLAYQSIFDSNSPVHIKVRSSDAEQIFLDQCRLAWHMSNTETTIKVNGTTKEFEITNKHTPHFPRPRTSDE